MDEIFVEKTEADRNPGAIAEGADTAQAASDPSGADRGGTVLVPESVWMDELNQEPLPVLLERADALGLRINPDKTRHQIVFELLRTYGGRGTALYAEGVFEQTGQGGGFLRWPRFNFRSLPQDVYVSSHWERQLFLRSGNKVAGRIRLPREREKFLALEEVQTIDGTPVGEWVEPLEFDRLTAMHPYERFVLERPNSVTTRALDLMAPLGRGQRGLIVAPPRTGKTILMKEIAKAILANAPDTCLILLLVDERPEEVTDFKNSLESCEIYSSTFDESAQRHTQLAELVGERAKRLVEQKKHVVILMDSITRLSRGYNNLTGGGKGRTMSGGVDSKALVKPKKFFSAARNTEEGGSLTVLATALVETNSRMDDLIFEEYKGTGNMEIRLDRTLADKRVFPALNLPGSGTRRDDLLYHAQEFAKVNVLRKQLAALPAMEATEVLIHAIRATKSNAELLLVGLR
jgi:transcription termination factor Rho